VVQEAVELWELTVGRDIFSDDLAAGFPIRFVYDLRQENLQKQTSLEKEFEEEGRRLNLERSAMGDRRTRYLDSETAYRERVEEFDRRASDHNAIVRDWNERGGAPEDIGQGLRETEEELQAEHLELNVQEQELESLRRSLLDGDERLRGEVDEHRGRGVELERLFPPTRVEAGLYREAVQRQNGRVVAIQRGIEIYRFGSIDDLRFLVAHELGHALGLGHSTVLGALMSEEHDGDGLFTGLGIQPSDVDLLRSRCPEFLRPLFHLDREARRANPPRHIHKLDHATVRDRPVGADDHGDIRTPSKREEQLFGKVGLNHVALVNQDTPVAKNGEGKRGLIHFFDGRGAGKLHFHGLSNDVSRYHHQDH